ncbi:hypothetical protein [Pseudoalteromonas tunicata]|jgi:hypothetical protein|uniref:Putative orphan protein n=1 Tax=Pseudoalteromonas tunicata D2 TaxID=87626 RepID=A4C7R2_9GAMM|nr:hypothetical protein [Pseudoalteromonas tunicata]ATC93133.1 hypothetical protein PTUN_a0322 [Pseudoalteromonas tunicata]AXT32205.1 hypothetical protein D1819_16170 [Pseudoalteromonas tunicata]EAR28627.1 putative orphan protein [Pseudoalteromonas tunicata D2]MDP4985817.1 hypothetical protein [Pseudoalteromonas tunicata]MDP5212689.1 hypothetical protein [Pseudoalteromonas tunicata]
MKLELTLLGVVILFLGVEPFIRQALQSMKKRTWRVCKVEAVTLVSSNKAMPFAQTVNQQMLVEYSFEQQRLSVMMNYNKHFYNNYLEQIESHLLVDPNAPNRAQMHTLRNPFIGVIFMVIGIFVVFYAQLIVA